jgi:hypothetical protein
MRKTAQSIVGCAGWSTGVAWSIAPVDLLLVRGLLALRSDREFKRWLRS